MLRFIICNHNISHTPPLNIIGKGKRATATNIVSYNQALATNQRRVNSTLATRCCTHIQHPAATQIQPFKQVANKLRRRLLNIVGTAMHKWIERKLRAFFKVTTILRPTDTLSIKGLGRFHWVKTYRHFRLGVERSKQTRRLIIAHCTTHRRLKLLGKW